MESIKKIDATFSEILHSLGDEITKLTFEEICEFKLNKQHIPEIPWGTLNYSGVYMFEIKNQGNHNSIKSWVDEFTAKWEDIKYKQHFTPNLRKKRIEKHDKLKEWIPIYIGKSRRIEGRVHEHIFMDLYKTTFALKLNARENLQDEIFKLHTIKCEVNNYDWIVPLIESKKRDIINPIVGRQ